MSDWCKNCHRHKSSHNEHGDCPPKPRNTQFEPDYAIKDEEIDLSAEKAGSSHGK
jgi:hypothetical protein